MLIFHQMALFFSIVFTRQVLKIKMQLFGMTSFFRHRVSSVG